MSKIQSDYNKLSQKSEIESQIKDLIGGYNLDQLVSLRKSLDAHYKANYKSKE